MRNGARESRHTPIRGGTTGRNRWSSLMLCCAIGNLRTQCGKHQSNFTSRHGNPWLVGTQCRSATVAEMVLYVPHDAPTQNGRRCTALGPRSTPTSRCQRSTVHSPKSISNSACSQRMKAASLRTTATQCDDNNTTEEDAIRSHVPHPPSRRTPLRSGSPGRSKPACHTSSTGEPREACWCLSTPASQPRRWRVNCDSRPQTTQTAQTQVCDVDAG